MHSEGFGPTSSGIRDQRLSRRENFFTNLISTISVHRVEGSRVGRLLFASADATTCPDSSQEKSVLFGHTNGSGAVQTRPDPSRSFSLSAAALCFSCRLLVRLDSTRLLVIQYECSEVRGVRSGGRPRGHESGARAERSARVECSHLRPDPPSRRDPLSISRAAAAAALLHSTPLQLEIASSRRAVLCRASRLPLVASVLFSSLLFSSILFNPLQSSSLFCSSILRMRRDAGLRQVDALVNASMAMLCASH